HPSKDGWICSVVRALDNAPRRAVPMLDQRLYRVVVVSHGPNVAGRDGGHCEEDVNTGSYNVRALDDLPTGTVPVFDQRLGDQAAAGVVVGSHRPDVLPRDFC